MIVDRTNTPAHLWVLCVMYVLALFNHTAHESLGNIPPIEKTKGYRPDVSKFLQYRWYEPVYYLYVSRLNEIVATDTFFSEVEALDDGIPGHGGCTMVQLYSGVTSHLLAAYPM